MESKYNNNKAGYYHVISRGINKQIIFEDDNDYSRYLNFLTKYVVIYNVNVLSYCLMNNHVHILVYGDIQEISRFMKCVNQCYVNSYNLRYERIGSLIQNSLKKILIADTRYLSNVFFYILKNPARANISSGDNYLWNSYKEYFHDSCIIDNIMAKEIYGDVQNLEHIIKADNNINVIWKHNPEKDAVLRDLIYNKYNITNMKQIMYVSINIRNEIIKILKENGMSGKKICSITGLSRGIVQKV